MLHVHEHHMNGFEMMGLPKLLHRHDLFLERAFFVLECVLVSILLNYSPCDKLRSSLPLRCPPYHRGVCWRARHYESPLSFSMPACFVCWPRLPEATSVPYGRLRCRN